MGIGHLAASFALRSKFPRVPLYVLLVAGVLVDLFWGVAIVAGLEHAHVDPASPSSVPLVLDSTPFTHSLLACVGWGVLAAGAWGLARRDRGGALVLGPPPPSVTPLAVGNIALALLLLPIEWVDRHRQVEPARRELR